MTYDQARLDTMARWYVYVHSPDLPIVTTRKTLWSPSDVDARERAERAGYVVERVEPAPPASAS